MMKFCIETLKKNPEKSCVYYAIVGIICCRSELLSSTICEGSKSTKERLPIAIFCIAINILKFHFSTDHAGHPAKIQANTFQL